MAMDKAREEQYIINQYHENMRQNEKAMDDLSKQEKELENKEQEMYDFKDAFRNYINTEHSFDGYPSEVRQTDEMKTYYGEWDDFVTELEADIRSTERCYEEEYEHLQQEKKKLLEREELYAEELQKSLKTLDENQEIK